MSLSETLNQARQQASPDPARPLSFRIIRDKVKPLLLEDSTRSEPVRDEIAVCRDAIRDRAAKPETLSWPDGATVSEPTGPDDPTRAVYGLVEGEDRFGATSSTRWECRVRRLMAGGWMVEELDW